MFQVVTCAIEIHRRVIFTTCISWYLAQTIYFRAVKFIQLFIMPSCSLNNDLDREKLLISYLHAIKLFLTSVYFHYNLHSMTLDRLTYIPTLPITSSCAIFDLKKIKFATAIGKVGFKQHRKCKCDVWQAFEVPKRRWSSYTICRSASAELHTSSRRYFFTFAN
jgi:hypothetical protein